MLFAVHALDRSDIAARRREAFEAFRDYLAQSRSLGTTVVMAGPLLDDSGANFIGGLFLIDARDRAAAEAFVYGSPYQTQGIWETVHIHSYRRMYG